MDREFAEILYRALMMIVQFLERRFGFGKRRYTRLDYKEEITTPDTLEVK